MDGLFGVLRPIVVSAVLGSVLLSNSDGFAQQIGQCAVGCTTRGCTDKGCTDARQWMTVPGQPGEVAQPATEPSVEQPAQPPAQQPLTFQPTQQPMAAQNLASSLFDNGVGSQLTNRSTIPGYIENAAPMNQFRMRFDALFDNEFPDRAEFFYGQTSGIGRGIGIGNGLSPNSLVDMYDARAYLEVKTAPNFSVFTDIPVRWIEADNGIGGQSGNTGGLGDLEAGIKYALVNDSDTTSTFMLRGYFPTGKVRDGLGTGHYSIEPGWLFRQRLSSQVVAFGEVRDWISIDGTDFAGNVLRYGIGLAFRAIDNCDYSLSPIAEAVGWSVLDGKQTNPQTLAIEDANTTIINLKLGVRINFSKNGQKDARSLYFGVGHAVTNSAWYENIVRVDYTVFF